MSELNHVDPERYALPADWTRRLLSPALVVHLDAVRANVGRVLAAMDGDADRWRVHVKTTKLPAVFRELVRAGLSRFKCATTREARELLATFEQEGLSDGELLLAHPLRGPALAELGSLAVRHPATRVSVLVEDAEVLDELPESLAVHLDLNPGMDRTGVPLAQTSEILGLARAAGPRLAGLHAYEGHLAGLAPGRRRAEARAVYGSLMLLLEACSGAGIRVDELITSGTPTFRDALDFEPFAELGGTHHRVSPGTVVYHDLNTQAEHPDLGLEPAAVVFSRVVSHPAPGLVTCDAGSKSLAAEVTGTCAVALGHPELSALRPNEEHLPFAVGGELAPARGTELTLVPRHVCPTVNLAEEALLVDGGSVLGAVPVSSRAHDLLATE